jgi:hypothetical protein
MCCCCSSGWIQHREVGAPKEYHYDTSMTWCREHGWTQEQLGNCPFYPQIGSIFYLTAAGGPTGRPHPCTALTLVIILSVSLMYVCLSVCLSAAVFDFHSHEHNSVPPIPERVALSFPQRNRMGLFRGNRYHGVMVSACLPACCVPAA